MKVKKVSKPFEGDNYMVAQAINRNAEVLEDALRRIEKLERQRKDEETTKEDPVADRIKAEFKRQGKWLFQAGYNAYNVDLAFRTLEFNILKMVEESNGRSK